MCIVNVVDTKSITAMRMLLTMLPDHKMKANPGAMVKVISVRELPHVRAYLSVIKNGQ